VQHKPTISEEDLRKLYSSSAFDMNTTVGLQNKVWFEVMLFFWRRGQEKLDELKRDSSTFSMDAIGRCFVYQHNDDLTKNHIEDCEAQEGGIMYEIPGSPNDPLDVHVHAISFSVHYTCTYICFCTFINIYIRPSC